ncbi:MAG: ATP-binding protein [Bacteroidales bacterium]|nr:ATP-binding protein [Bacteroidales bacterium]
MKTRKKLPTGIQTFEKLIKGDNIYVDKTEYLVRLIDDGSTYFLARPRRFGKSLTTSTFAAIFSGEKDLFKGLYAEEFLNRPDFEPSPVIHLDMSKVITSRGMDGIDESIKMLTKDAAKKLEIELQDTRLCGILLNELIVKAKDKYKSKVVVLIDEYDKPYTDFINDLEMADKVRNILRDYYIQIKANDEHIKFSFLTGISKFARLGVFSTLNSPLDISMIPEYAEICGYTEAEIIKYFPDYLEETAEEMEISVEELMERIRYHYDGFTFDSKAKTRLYCPYSTLSFFENREFFNYWIDTGRSKFIADYMKDKHLTVEQFRNLPVSKDFATPPGDMDTAPPEGFFLQSGYLTLRPGIGGNFLLDYPNTEVLNSMSELLTKNILGDSDAERFKNNVYRQIIESNTDGFMRTLNVLLANIPYDDYNRAAQRQVEDNNYPFTAGEWLYRSSILSFLHGTGIKVEGEPHNNKGKADLVMKYQDCVWIVELKVAYKTEEIQKKLEEAKNQIITNQYAKPYPHAICLAIVIDDEKRQIVKCEQIN